MHEAFKLAPDDWAQLRALLDEALALPPAVRDAWLDRLDDRRHGALKPRLRSLLAHAPALAGEVGGDAGRDAGSEAGTGGERQADPAARWLGTLPKIETAQFAPAASAMHTDLAGRWVGPYRVLRELGRGGMASVWLAERDDMLQGRQVALKLPHAAAHDDGLAERLRREREILATLEHPHIARLYDAGTTDAGQPYLALEYVEGERLDRWCELHQSDLAQRLALFVQVVRAVAHAHAHLVVHRDLKPANILVTADGQVRLLDFGIARLLEGGAAADTALTQQAGRALTPDYAAPEQILGRPPGTAADVYALGVVLFELLAGRRPYRLERSTRGALEDAILHADVPRPSSVATGPWRRALRGDLDTIVLKALKKEPAERYATADALADDIERHLQHLPVRARPDSALYRLRKFAARHRLAVGLGSALAVAVVAGSAVSLQQADAARAAQRRSEQALAFVTQMFRDADPYQSAERPPDAAALLQRARARIDTEFPDAPLLRAELLVVVAEAQVGLNQEAAAEEASRAALALLASVAEAPADLVVRARLALAEAHFFRDQLPAARTALEQAQAMIDTRGDLLAAQRLPALSLQVQLLVDEGRAIEAESAASQALALAEPRGEREAARRIELWRTLAVARQMRGDRPGAIEAAGRALAVAAAHYRHDSGHPDLLDTQMRYGRVLAGSARSAEGLALMERTLARAIAQNGAASRTAALYEHRLAMARLDVGELELARQGAERALAGARAHYGPTAPLVGGVLGTSARIALALRQPGEALALADAAMAIYAPQQDELALVLLRGLQAQARAWLGQSRAAVDELQALLPAARRLGAAHHARVLTYLGMAQRLAGHADEALATLDEALRLSATLGERAREHAEIQAERAQALLARGDAGAALREFTTARSVLDTPPTPLLAEIRLGTARAHLARGDAEQAQADASAAEAYWTQQGRTDRWTGEAAFWLARSLAASGQTDAARQARERAMSGLRGSAYPGDAALLAELGTPAQAAPTPR